MKKILVLSKYGALAASTRQRFVQYTPFFNDEGLELDIRPLLSDEYLNDSFNNSKVNRLKILLSYFKRLFIVIFKRDFDLIIVQYELFPYLPSIFERLVFLSKKKVVYECDDAAFQQYFAHKESLFRKIVRFFLGKKIEPLVAGSNLAICGNDYLESWAKTFCKKTEIVPTVVDADLYTPNNNKSEGVTIGWIGSPSTYQYVSPIKEMLEHLIINNNIKVSIIGSGKRNSSSSLFNFIEWNEVDEVKFIQNMDIGIMPLPDDLWSKGKCGYKLIQYMSCGLPVIASPVGVNKKIIDDGVNGFLVDSIQEWQEKIIELVNNPELRDDMGKRGRLRVLDWYCTEKQGPRLVKMISKILEERI